MARTPSPLRYPGGKAAIKKIVAEIIKENKLNKCCYVEPYAGGCGLALSLLFEEYVDKLYLNDLDRAIWAFWDSIINDTERFIDKIETTPITIEEWYRQRDIQKNKENFDDFSLGFSSFFLNRTNRSGIILKAGVIGGIKQSGNYKLDCRFNKNRLIQQIRRIEEYKHRIHLYNTDAITFIQKMDEILPPNTLYCIDPPYYEKGSTLYTNFYKCKDHIKLSQIILHLKRNWILTYDNVEEITNLYNSVKQFRFDLNYSVARKRIGTELLILSDKIVISNEKIELLSLHPVITKN